MKIDWRIMGIPVCESEEMAIELRRHVKFICLVGGFSSKGEAEEVLKKGIKRGEFRPDCFIKSQRVKNCTIVSRLPSAKAFLFNEIALSHRMGKPDFKSVMGEYFEYEVTSGP